MKCWVLSVSLVAAAACVGAQTHPGAHKGTARPDLHGGGARPSAIPNHVTTLVTLPGFHLSGTTVTTDGVCSLKSYKVVSDNEIQMEIEGNRPVDGKEDGCFLHVHQGAVEAHTYVIVELSEAESNEKDTKQQAANKAKFDAYSAHLGNVWSLRFADGSTETYTAQPAQEGELPDFTASSGGTAKILIGNDGKVWITSDGCLRSGTLAGGQVKDGTSMAGCKPAGAWTAQRK